MAAGSTAAPPLEAGKPIALSGTKGRFDFIAVDPARRRLLAAHTGNNSLDVFDLEKQSLIKSVATGAAQGEGIDPKGAKYYASVSKPPQMAIVDAETLEVTAKVALGGEADVMTVNAVSGQAYVCHDEAKEVWVIDPGQAKIVATIELPSAAPEDLAFDGDAKHLFQNLKNANAVAVIDPATNKVTTTWPTAPAQSPHGMAIVPESNAILVVGGNGKLVLMSQKDGKVLSSADVASRIDQLAYDPGLHRAYGASGAGKISVVQVDGEKLTSLGDVSSADGAHSVAVDPKTHTVWIAYAKGDSSFVQPFAAK
jgi:DNA-binding beta-propeller fold protein YncE